LASKDDASVDFPVVDADASTGRHGDGLIVERLLRIRQASILSHQWLVKISETTCINLAA